MMQMHRDKLENILLLYPKDLSQEDWREVFDVYNYCFDTAITFCDGCKNLKEAIFEKVLRVYTFNPEPKE